MNGPPENGKGRQWQADDREQTEVSAELITQGQSQRNGDGSGPLRKVLETAISIDATNDVRTPLSEYTVLSPQNDPYRLDLPDNHQNGAWFKEVVERLVPEGQSVHLLGLHYRLVAAAAVHNSRQLLRR
jgi:hypothetical protein